MRFKTDPYQYTLILGKGFALNVYLPALNIIGCKNIVLDSESKAIVYSNKNLNKIKSNIKWINSYDINKRYFSKIIIAEPPIKQFELISKRSIWKNCNHLILEKPLAENHIKARSLINILTKNKISHSINYSFRYMKWFNIINTYLKNNFNKGEVTLNWKFKCRHIIKKSHSWKNNHSSGGGALRYYGIHLIAILSDIGYENINNTNIDNQSNNTTKWTCQFQRTENLPRINLFLDCNSNENKFIWKQNKYCILELENPFSLESNNLYSDTRIQLAINFLKEKNSDLLINKNSKALDLWSKVESKI